MPYTRKDYAGGAADTTLNTGISNADTTITLAAATGWPSGTNGPFVIVINPGTSSEEKVLIQSRSGTSLTVATSGRGYDGTTAASHSVGATVRHSISAVDFDEANYWVTELAAAATAANDLIIADGNDSLSRIAKGSNSTVLAVDSGGTLGYTTVTSAMITDATIATGDLADGAVTSAKIADGTIVAGDLASNSVTTAKIADDAVTSAKILDGTIATGDLADGSVTDAKLRDSAALTVIGRSANSTGDPADIAAGTDGHVLRRSGTSLGFGTVATAGIADDAVTIAKISLASNPTTDTQASRKAYVDLKGRQAILNAQSATPIVNTTSTATTASGATSLAEVTITNPGYDIYVWGHASIGWFIQQGTQSADWALWSLIITVNSGTGGADQVIDRLDVPVNKFLVEAPLGLSIGCPLRRVSRASGANTVVKMKVYRQGGNGTFSVGGDGTMNHLQVYWVQQ
jgi:hypothetical protein